VDPGINLDAAIIPPMLIQPFIENAIEHGIRNKQDEGHVNVRFRLEENKIICEIEDDGIGREKAWETAYTKKGKHKSLATEIIRDRINILNRKFRHKISLDIIDLRPGSGKVSGTLVRLDLPYILD
jgi:sensor histidine kinase YesM